MVFLSNERRTIILKAKNLAPLSISIFFLFKTDYFKFLYYSDDVPVSKDYFCHKFKCIGNLGIHRHFFGEECQTIDFLP